MLFDVQKWLRYLRRGKYLILLLLGGLLLRLFTLTQRSIWFDEAASVYVARIPLTALLPSLARIEYLPPFYYLLFQLWMSVYTSWWWLELFSVLFGLASIVFIYKMGSFLYGRKVGHYAAFLMALACLQIRFSQEIRMYSLLVFLGLVSNYYFLKVLREDKKQPKRQDWVFYVLATLLALYTHYYAGLLLLAQALFFVFFYKDWKLTKKWLVSQSVIALAFAPWLPFFFQQVTRVQQDYWITQPTLKKVLDVIVFMADNVVTLAVLGILVLGGIFSLYRITKGKIILRKEKPNYFLVFQLVIPFVVALLISLVTNSIFYERYFILFTPSLYLLAAKGFSHINNRLIAGIFVVGFLAGTALCLVPYYGSANMDIEDTANFVQSEMQEGDILVHVNPFALLSFILYHDGAVENYLLSSKPLPVYLGGNYYEDTIYIKSVAELEGKRRVWFIDREELNEKVRLAMQGRGAIVHEENRGEVKVVVYEMGDG